MNTPQHWRWGRAGIRRDPNERARALARRQQRDAARQHDADVAYRLWAEGRVVPHNITAALDAHNLYGPAVDHACNADEPAVDLWEAGKLYPRFDQLEALARLTGKTVRWFCEPPRNQIGVLSTSLRFHLTADDLADLVERDTSAVLRYPDAVVAQCPGTRAATRDT